MFSTRKIKIDKGLYDRLREAADAAGYATTEELIVHVLERAVVDREEVDQKQAEDQLRGLGYIE